MGTIGQVVVNRKQRRMQAKTSPAEAGKLQKTYAEALSHHQAGRLADAERLYRQALLLDANHADSLHLLGVLAHQSGRNDAAIELIGKAIGIKADVARYHFNLGTILQAAGKPEPAVLALDQARRLNPTHVEAYFNLGAALFDLDRMDEAARIFLLSICLSPDQAKPYYNLGTALKELGRNEAALAVFAAALRLKPDYAEAHFDLALAHLALGNFAAGWPEFEWRWRGGQGQTPRQFAPPQWRGQDIAGKTILLHAEQGFGDTIQFCRYVPQLAASGATILLEAPRPLLPLLAGLPGVSRLIAAGDNLPAFDLHCPLMSLPGLFGTRMDSIPAPIPYLGAGSDGLARWKERLESARGLKVGLVWAGRPTYRRDRARSMPFAALGPLWDIEGVSWYSLQVGERQSDLSSDPAGRIEDLSPYLSDFSETAAALSEMDLVVTVDTAIAHLAGALGRPCWVMLPFFTDWRWLMGRTDSPWYPSLRLFRQSERGDWGNVVASITDALTQRVGRQNIPAAPEV